MGYFWQQAPQNGQHGSEKILVLFGPAAQIWFEQLLLQSTSKEWGNCLCLWGLSHLLRHPFITDVSLTFRQGVIDAEAAQDFIIIAGVEESISSDHHLKGLCMRTYARRNYMNVTSLNVKKNISLCSPRMTHQPISAKTIKNKKMHSLNKIAPSRAFPSPGAVSESGFGENPELFHSD